MPARNYIELVAKTMGVLEVLAQHPEGCALKELAQRTGLVKSSVFRILHTLRELGYVEQTGTEGEYQSTTKTLSLGRAAASHELVISVARPHLQNLRNEVGESAWLAQKLTEDVRLVDVAEAPQRLRLSLDIGDSCPVHAAGLGKAIAAFLPPEELDRFLEGPPLPCYTRKTITDRDRLVKHLAQIRRLGYAINNQETIDGAVMVGAPVFDALRRPCAALSVGSATARFRNHHRKAIVEGVKRESAAISLKLAELGYRSRY